MPQDVPDSYKELAEFSAEVYAHAMEIMGDRPIGFVIVAINTNSGGLSTTSSNSDSQEVATLLAEAARLMLEEKPAYIEIEDERLN